ncbi:hypothetical protein F3Y22_tig00112888pilonHSYRG00055 [Hibiscus syriacus]|uniref:Reverse transcriptase zinc-binding domain-containing protein n=1 Tax=Hibiscus syriacus TaxID=106335 RepID=A0A6A2WRV4_HIBSY|nr:hypothetical protein F3Y22_tig00112888pilonHSYRG00055 [Hibiscus syriacus]
MCNNVQSNPEDTVSDFIRNDGNWDLENINSFVDEDIARKITVVPPPYRDDGADLPIWLWEDSRTYIIKSSYRELRHVSWEAKDNIWTIAWNFDGPQRIHNFIWLTLRNRLLTNMERARRGLTSDPSCPSCGESVENILHVVCDCPDAKITWLQILPSHDAGSFFSFSLLDWLNTNHKNLVGTIGNGYRWNNLFGIVMWRLWKNRCNLIFNGVSCSPLVTIQATQEWAHSISNRKLSHSSTATRSTMNQRWNPPNIVGIAILNNPPADLLSFIQADKQARSRNLVLYQVLLFILL